MMRWFGARARGVALYQDVVVSGRTVARGRRDCQARWEHIAPHLPAEATILDIGSNFGWFGLQACAESERRLVVSVEADESSAHLQRHILASHELRRVVLLTRRAGVAMATQWAKSQQRFHAALCLSVLHWIPQHEQFVRLLGALTDRLFIEHPDPRESGAGIVALRQGIGPLGDYLTRLFPDRPCTRLANVPSHRESPFPRELWMVDAPTDRPRATSAVLDAATLLQLSTSWPQRSWWQSELAKLQAEASHATSSIGQIALTPSGLQWQNAATTPRRTALRRVFRLASSVPEARLYSHKDWLQHRIRRAAAALLHRA